MRCWTTDKVGPGRRLDYWVGAICEAFLEMDCSSRETGQFDGRLSSLSVGDLSFNQVVASSQDVFRTSGAIARSARHPFYLITQFQQPWHVRQGGRLQQLRPGDAALVDSAQCYELHFPQAVACLSVQVPRAWLGRWLRTVDDPAPRVAPRDQGWGRVLSALCLELGQAPTLATAYPEALLTDHVGALLAASLEPVQAAPTPSATRRLVERATDLLRQRLIEPGLTGERVAVELGVSARTLHRAFAADGASFAATLQRLRLEQAREWLMQPRLATLTVAEIGRRSGFADASHFVRAFQRSFGETPARWRHDRRRA